MARQWGRVDEDTAVGPRFGQDPRANTGQHVPTMETRPFDLGKSDLIVAEEAAGGMAFWTAQRREPDCSRRRHGRCIGAG